MADENEEENDEEENDEEENDIEPKTLDNLTFLADLLWRLYLRDEFLQQHSPRAVKAGSMYCPHCGDDRRMTISLVYSIVVNSGFRLAEGDAEADLVPSMFFFTCVQCETNFTAVIFRGPDGPSLAVFPTTYGGLATPHTPVPVAFYLDQAQRARSVGAHSAALSMFRAALEQMLFQQGYETRMLGPKIGELEKAITDGTAPKWTENITPELLEVLKKLGDTSIHPNEGDISKQADFDSQFVAKVQGAFKFILHVVYEEEEKKRLLLEELKRPLAETPLEQNSTQAGKESDD